jgi:hypothetical protein
MTDKVQSRLPTGSGLPVAVFVPWKQTWTLRARGRVDVEVRLIAAENVAARLLRAQAGRETGRDPVLVRGRRNPGRGPQGFPRTTLPTPWLEPRLREGAARA